MQLQIWEMKSLCEDNVATISTMSYQNTLLHQSELRTLSGQIVKMETGQSWVKTMASDHITGMFTLDITAAFVIPFK